MKSKLAVIASCIYAAVVLFVSVLAGNEYMVVHGAMRGETLIMDFVTTSFLVILVGGVLGLVAGLFIGGMVDLWQSQSRERLRRH